LSYGEKTAEFNELAIKNNISRVHDGLGLLFRQAALSLKIWTGLKPNAEEAMKIFRI
jgi:shikimate 5-dehydrogenase